MGVLVMRPKRFIISHVKDQVPQKMKKEELILEVAQDVLSKAKLLAWAAKEREKNDEEKDNT
jgi:hypothetical protein